MENNYINIPSEDNSQLLIQRKDYNLWIKQLILTLSALSTFIGGLLFNHLIQENTKNQPECVSTARFLKYYSQYLLIDGSAQLIICFIIICILSCFKLFKLKKEINKQLMFQVIDMLLLLVTLLIIEVYVKQKRSCITIKVNIFLVIYSFWIYLLLFILALVRFNQQ